MLTVDNVKIATLGPCGVASPLKLNTVYGDGVGNYVSDETRVRHTVEITGKGMDAPEMLLEKAGPRAHLFFAPQNTRAAIVTCGGLCPGLNNVIRSAFLELHHNYGVSEVFGIRYGYQGLNPAIGMPPMRLSTELVGGIHAEGGSILGASRGPQPTEAMVDFLAAQRINILLCVGGDGTQRGAHDICEEVHRRGLPIAIVGIPKTIDNDIACVSRTFGFSTAIEEARDVLACAHVEADAALNGIGLVKLMGRDAGFIAAGAALASQEVNFALIPEVPFALEGEDGFLSALKQRLLARRHALIAVAEGAGQELLKDIAEARDASGNIKRGDIGLYLRDAIEAFFRQQNMPVSIKYFDPSYIIRSVRANCDDSLLCDQLARNAVHAGMAGKTDVLIGLWNDVFTHVPISVAVLGKKRVCPEGELWRGVLAATGQPHAFGKHHGESKD